MAAKTERNDVMTNLSKAPRAHNGILSDETTTAILETYIRLHGPCTEEQMAAVLQAATDAAVSLTCFQMTMRGDLIPELKAGATASADSTLEHCGDIMRRVLKEAGL
mgnify:CR=1 FL=1